MILIRKHTKTAVKAAFVLTLIAVIIYTFRDSAGPILKELGETTPIVVILISILAILYELVEGWITCSFARRYQPEFTYWMGVESAFYCSFYRVATLGSGAGVAAVYYFNEKGIPVSKGTGMYMVEYVLHKVTIALFSAVFFVFSFGFMQKHYAEYEWMLIGGYGITIVIAVALLLFCCSKRVHGLLLWLLDKLNRNGKLNEQAMAITSLSVMLAAVIPTPAGIGSTEFVFTMLFAGLVGMGDAGSATLLYRFATFVLPFLIGAVIVIVRRIRQKTRPVDARG